MMLDGSSCFYNAVNW